MLVHVILPLILQYDLMLVHVILPFILQYDLMLVHVILPLIFEYTQFIFCKQSESMNAGPYIYIYMITINI